MSLKSTSLSVWEKLDLIPVVFRIASAAFYAAVTAPFRSSNTPNTFKNHILLSASRAGFARLSLRQRRYLTGSTASKYLAWLKTSEFRPESVTVKDGTQVFWIGSPSAEHVVLYFHGGGWSMPAGGGHFELAASTVRKAEAEMKSLSFAIVQHDLAPEAQYPTQISQCVEALDYTLNTLGKHPSKIVLAGDSAGGTLVMSVVSHLLHPRPDINPIKLVSHLKAAVIFSPWLDFDMSSSSVLESQMQDPVSPDVMRDWARDYLGGSPLDNYNQPGIAPAEWWRGMPVENILITGGASEMGAEDITAFSEKIKTVHGSTTVFFAAEDFHAQPVIGPEMGMDVGEQGPIIQEFILKQIE